MHIGMIIFLKEDTHRYVYILEGRMHIGMIIFLKEDTHRYVYILEGGCT